MGTGRRLIAALLALMAAAGVQAAARPQVQFAEKVTLSSTTGHTEFDAYGRRFSLALQSNDRVLSRLKESHPKSLAGYRLWRGELAGQPGSWTRLTERAGRMDGVIWDGRDLYVVTSYERAASYLTTPLAAAAGDTIVFRLSDTLNFLPAGYCGVGPSTDGLASNNGLVQYRNMVAELQLAATGPTRQIEISMIADSALQARVTDSMGLMVESYNIVDGIYVEQVRLLILPTDMRLIPANGDPFTATGGSALLAQLSTYRQDTPAISSLAIAHLFTGKDLDGEPIGIARLGGACSATNGVSLTEGWLGSFSAALIMAHELGHNLGAEHDGAGSCASVPESFIMAPNLNGSTKFSSCSLSAMESFLAAASCATSPDYAHVELPQTHPVLLGELEEPFVLPVDVYSSGTRAAEGVTLDLRVHSSLVLTAMPAGVGCTPTTLGMRCTVGTIAAGATRHLEFTFLPGMAASFEFRVTVSATNNQNTRNAEQIYSVNILHNVDASVAVTTSKATAMFGDPVDITITVRSLKSHTARNVRVGTYGGGLTATSVDLPAGVTCQFNAGNPGQTFCIVGDMPGGSTRQIVLHTTASQIGTSLQGSVYMNSDNDPDSSNNNTYFTMRVDSVHDVALEDDTPSTPVQYNMPYEYKAKLRSLGAQSVDGVYVTVQLFMQDSRALNDVSSVTVGGNTCTKLAIYNYRCEVGTMATGEILPVSVKGIATGLGEMRFDLDAYASNQDNPSNNDIYRTLLVRYGLDVAASSGSQISGVEGVEQFSSASVTSNGVQTAAAVLNVEVPSQVRFTQFFVANTAVANCALVNPQHLRCNYNISAQVGYQSVSFGVIGDSPGSYQVTATVALAGDENPANNSVQWPITINPAIDVGVRGIAMPEYLIAGHDVTAPFTVFTGSRAVNAATVIVYAQGNAQLTSLTTSAGTCTRLDTQRFNCVFGDLPGGSTRDLSAVVSATATQGSGQFGATVQTVSDNVPSNNFRSVSFQTAPAGDARVEVATAHVAGTAGTAFALPAIRVWRAGEVVRGRLRITLPAGVTVTAVSGSVFACSGTTTLECELPSSWPEPQAIQVDLTLRAAAAVTGNVTARVTAMNDFANANDEASIAVTVGAASSPNPPPSNPPSNPPGGGGGGRIEWPVAIFVGLLLTRRQWRRICRLD